jgi:hypothetical protein
MNKSKVRSFMLCSLLLATVALLGFSGQPVAKTLQDIYANNLFTQYLLTGNITGGSGGIQQGSQWIPGLKLTALPGTSIFGPLTVNNNSGRGPGVKVEDCTGLGSGPGNTFQNGCDIKTYSSDSVGQIWLTGAAGSSSQGTFTMYMGQTWPEDAICTLTLIDLYAAWDPKATARIIPDPCTKSGHSCPQETMTIAWDNNGVALPYGGGGPGNGINYHCLALPWLSKA